jgi:hypothetical protein
MEPLGSLFGAGIAGGLALAYPVGLGLAAGAMIFVVSHEVIPETHRNGHQTSGHPRADGGLRGDDVPGYGAGLRRRTLPAWRAPSTHRGGWRGRRRPEPTAVVFREEIVMKKSTNKSAGPVMDIGISADDRAEIAAGLSRLLADSFTST